MGRIQECLPATGGLREADVLTTSYTLAQCVRKMGKYDLVICGKQTTDGDTGQVGPEMAEWLEIPRVQCDRSR